VPFALHDILILVFGNHGKMNRGLLQWRVPAATSVDQETTTDDEACWHTRNSKTHCEFQKRNCVARELDAKRGAEYLESAQRETNDP